MALIKCSECGAEISDKATTCPHCGNPICSSDVVLPTEITDDSQVNPKNKKEKSSLKRALSLWLLLIVEFIGVIVFAMVAPDAITQTIYILTAIFVFNTILGIVLFIKTAKSAIIAIKRRKGFVKTIVAAVLCVAFVIPNAGFAYSGYSAFNGENNSTEKQIAIEACKDLKARMKNPSSLELHTVLVCEDVDYSTYVYIDCSGMNGFGGSARNTYVYRNGSYLGKLEDSSLAQSVLSFCQTTGTCTSISVSMINRKI